MRKVMIGAALAGAAFLLSACSMSDHLADRVIGPADSLDQRVYRAAGAYAVVGTYVCHYLDQPTAAPGVAARLQQASAATWQALVRARAATVLGEPATALAALAGSLTALGRDVVAVSADDGRAPPLSVAYVAERVAGLLSSAVALQPRLVEHRGRLATLVLDNRPPAQAEWDAVMAEAERARKCLGVSHG